MYGITWKIDPNTGNLIISLPDPDERVEVMALFYRNEEANTPETIYNFPVELADRYNQYVQENDIPELSGNQLEYEVFERMITNGFEFDNEDRPYFSQDVEYDDDDEPTGEVGRMWDNDSYALYDSDGGVETLAKTGRCVWTLFHDASSPADEPDDEINLRKAIVPVISDYNPTTDGRGKAICLTLGKLSIFFSETTPIAFAFEGKYVYSESRMGSADGRRLSMIGSKKPAGRIPREQFLALLNHALIENGQTYSNLYSGEKKIGHATLKNAAIWNCNHPEFIDLLCRTAFGSRPPGTVTYTFISKKKDTRTFAVTVTQEPAHG